MAKEIVKFIRKANDLVEARYKFDIWETRLFTKMLTMIHRTDEDFKDYKIYLRDIVHDFDLAKNKEAYEFLREGARKLMKKSFYIPYEVDGVRRLFETPVVSSLDSAVTEKGRVHEDHLYITVSFHPKMKPYLLQLKSQFTMYDVRNILKLPSTYSIRIYELLKQYERIGTRTFVVLELKEILGIENKYKLYGHFKNRVLEKAKKDLEKFTDIHFTYDEIKRGRAVHKLKFWIHKNQPESLKISEPKTTKKPTTSSKTATKNKSFVELYSKVEAWVSEDTFLRWLVEFSEDKIRDSIRYTLNQIEKGTEIKNVAGYLLAMMRQTVIVDEVQIRKEKVVEKKQKERSRAERKLELETREKQLRLALHNEELAVIEKLFASNPGALIKTIAVAKESRVSGYNLDKTDLGNYEENMLFRLAVHNKVKDLFPDLFEPIEKKYLPEIKAVRDTILKV